MPIGERTARFGIAIAATPYKGFTLEIDDHIESPSVNFHGFDCWKFFETALGMARMFETRKQAYAPVDLLREIETTRYRGGKCGGNYLDRLHYLADWYDDNHRRGTILNLTKELGGVPFRNRRVSEMTTLWKSYRYLRNNPSLRPQMAKHERRVEQLPAYYVPTNRVAAIEGSLKNGDVIGIATKYNGGFCSHVGLAYRAKDGSMRLMHASSDQKKVIINVPIHQYLNRYNKHAGILVGRPIAFGDGRWKMEDGRWEMNRLVAAGSATRRSRQRPPSGALAPIFHLPSSIFVRKADSSGSSELGPGEAVAEAAPQK